jgi:putative membrane protein
MPMKYLALALGLGVLGLAWFGPLPVWARTSFTAHMTLHMLVVVAAAPLIAAALVAGGWDPVGWAPRLFSAIVASGVELIVVWGWHLPALHHAARDVAAVFVAEQLSFLASGLLFWISVLGGRRAMRAERAVPALIGLALTLAHMTLLGVLISLSPRPLYHHGTVALEAALRDQQHGGAVMLTMSLIAYVVGGLVAGRRLLALPPHARLEEA